jgi:hypothetical protein
MRLPPATMSSNAAWNQGAVGSPRAPNSLTYRSRCVLSLATQMITRAVTTRIDPTIVPPSSMAALVVRVRLCGFITEC